MTELYSASSSVSPITAIVWCFYPIAVLILVELILGGGFDDDNNDDQDGGMLIPAYSRSQVWNHIEFKVSCYEKFSVTWLAILIQLLFPWLHLPSLLFPFFLGLSS